MKLENELARLCDSCIHCQYIHNNMRIILCCYEHFCLFRSHFGEEVMGVEQGKKENRSEYGFYLTMKEFLDVRLGYSLTSR